MTLRAKDTLILWNDEHQSEYDEGFIIKAGIKGEPENKKYQYSSGNAWFAFQELPPKDQGHQLLALALELIVAYKLPPKLVDDEFQKIYEYKQALGDFPGNEMWNGN